MPRKNLDLTTLLSLPLPKVPEFDEFIMYLFNNGYSKHTIYNYFRDLVFFALFLNDYNIRFDDLNVRHINFYKGWLKDRRHIKAIQQWVRSIKSSIKESIGRDITSNTDLDGVDRNNGGSSLSRLGSSNNNEYLAELEAAFGKYLTDSADREVIRGHSTTRANSGGVDSTRNTGSVHPKGGNYAKNPNPSQLDANSINRMLSALRQYLRFLVEQGYKTPIVADQVKLVRSPKRLPNVPSLEDVLRLVESPSHIEKDPFIAARNRAMLETLLATGMRISELVSLNRDQLNREGKLFITGKGNKQRFVYLTARAMKYIDEYIRLRDDPYPALFVPKVKLSKREDPRITTAYLQAKIAEYRRILGIVVPITAHSIRHAFATYMVERGANPAILQRLLGHESLHTTTKYVHLNDIVAEREHSKFHPVKE